MYDVKKVTVVVDGVYLTGFSTGSVISAEMEEDRKLPYVAVDGEVVFSDNANNAGVVTVSLNSTSPSVKYLNGLASGKKVFGFTAIDQNENGVNCAGTQAFVRNPIFPEKGKEVTDVEFEIYVGDLEIK
jgi:hypothetical protein